MTEVRIPDGLWDTAKVPEGIVANWFYTDGSQIAAGATIAELMAEKTTYDIKAPVAGRLKIAVPKDGVVTPGSVIGRIE